jgi:hypothetical protein
MTKMDLDNHHYCDLLSYIYNMLNLDEMLVWWIQKNRIWVHSIVSHIGYLIALYNSCLLTCNKKFSVWVNDNTYLPSLLIVQSRTAKPFISLSDGELFSWKITAVAFSLFLLLNESSSSTTSFFFSFSFYYAFLNSKKFFLVDALFLHFLLIL